MKHLAWTAIVASGCYLSHGPPLVAENGCTSAVSGATPMRGYCSTRANLAPHRAPSAPVLGWQTSALMGPVLEMVVDESGRAYLALGPDMIENTLLIVEPNGAVSAQHNFGHDPVMDLFIGSDGALHAKVGVATPSLVRIDQHATISVEAPLPPHTYHFAIASDGSLIGTTFAASGGDRLMRIAADGAERWSWSPPDTCEGCISDVALTANDEAVVAIDESGGTSTRVARFDGGGTLTWSTPLEGIYVTGPAIAPDGSLRVITGVTDLAMRPTTVATALGRDGSVLWQTRLDEDFHGQWGATLVVGSDGATFLRSVGAVVALDAGGASRWRYPLSAAGYYYDAVSDAQGTLVILDGAVHGIDALTGQERWHLDGPPAERPYVSSLALARDGCLIGWANSVFTACDP